MDEDKTIIEWGVKIQTITGTYFPVIMVSGRWAYVKEINTCKEIPHLPPDVYMAAKPFPKSYYNK